MTDYRVVFDSLEWESPIPGVRHKIAVIDGRRLRFVEYSREMEPHWCDRGHAGIILDGKMEIEFESATHIFETGDGVFIPDGDAHRHRATVLSDIVTALFVEAS